MQPQSACPSRARCGRPAPPSSCRSAHSQPSSSNHTSNIHKNENAKSAGKPRGSPRTREEPLGILAVKKVVIILYLYGLCISWEATLARWRRFSDGKLPLSAENPYLHAQPLKLLYEGHWIMTKEQCLLRARGETPRLIMHLQSFRWFRWFCIILLFPFWRCFLDGGIFLIPESRRGDPFLYEKGRYEIKHLLHFALKTLQPPDRGLERRTRGEIRQRRGDLHVQTEGAIATTIQKSRPR